MQELVEYLPREISATSMVMIHYFNDFSFARFVDEVECKLELGADIISVGINSAGGELSACLGMMDYLTDLKNRGITVLTTNMAKAYSAGAFLLSCGHRRYAAPHSVVMLHEIQMSSPLVPISSYHREATSMKDMNRTLMEYFCKNLKIEERDWDTFIEKYFPKGEDVTLTATEAMDAGIITDIGIPHLTVENSMTALRFEDNE